jgi:hypothetical protein
MLDGQGVTPTQVPEPSWLCIKPVFWTPLLVDWTRTQPLLSCMMIARMKRSSTPLELAIDLMCSLIWSVSVSLLSQAEEMRILLSSQLKKVSVSLCLYCDLCS